MRHTLRTLLRSPAFTAVAVVSLALGIGANTALFSLIDAMLLQPLPVKNPGQLVEFARHTPDGATMTNMPRGVYEYLRRNSGVADVFALSGAGPVLRAGAAPEQCNAQQVSGEFFPVLGVNALLGRTFGPDDDHPESAGRVVVLSYRFWSTRFGQDGSILGTSVRLDSQSFTVIGVMPPSFIGVDRAAVPDFWLPLAGNPRYEPWVLARLKPGVSIPQAQAALEPLFHRALESVSVDHKTWPERDQTTFLGQKLLIHAAANGTATLRWGYWEYSPTLKILLGLTGMVLLIACANLANLLMARSAGRSREIAIRLAIGAGRWRLIRDLLGESLLLSVAGAALGLPVAVGGQRLLLAFLMRNPEAAALDFRVDVRVLGFTLGMSILTALLFGLAPAIRATRLDLHSETRRKGTANLPLARTLLAGQVALSMVLLAGAGLFARTLRNLGASDLGLVRENLLLIDVRAPGKTAPEWQQFWTRLDDNVSRLPGVRHEALAGTAVFGRGMWNQTVWLASPGQPPQHASVDMNPVAPGFFAATGIPMLVGRDFGVRDRDDAQLVAVVNQTFARRFLGDSHAIGQRLGDRGAASTDRYEIVGVVGDAKYRGVRDQIRPMVFYPLAQSEARSSRVLHVRTAADPATMVVALRRAILTADPDALITEVRTIPQVLQAQFRQERMFSTLSIFFALLALVLCVIGLYGVLTYRVARRTAEIGLRFAVGAQRRDVLWLIMRESVLIMAAGAMLGIPAALAATRLIKSLLFGLEPWDSPTLVCALAALFAAGALASYLPARRAAAVDPIAALRNE